jgi:hypothetical protein
MNTSQIDSRTDEIQVNFDQKLNALFLNMHSFNSQTIEIFVNILVWLKEYKKELIDEKVFTVNLKADYINSTTHKLLSDFFFILQYRAKKPDRVIVNWFYNNKLNNLKDIGSDFQKDFNHLTFKLIMLKNNMIKTDFTDFLAEKSVPVNT